MREASGQFHDPAVSRIANACISLSSGIIGAGRERQDVGNRRTFEKGEDFERRG